MVTVRVNNPILPNTPAMTAFARELKRKLPRSKPSAFTLLSKRLDRFEARIAKLEKPKPTIVPLSKRDVAWLRKQLAAASMKLLCDAKSAARRAGHIG